MNLKDFLDTKSVHITAILALVVGLLIGVGAMYIYQNQYKKTIAEPLSPQAAAQKAIDFINKNMLKEGVSASLIDVVEKSGLYKIKFQIENQKFESYVSKDGELLFVQGVNMGKEEKTRSEGYSKRDVPDVKLFVMSYCPFGLQAQKALLPAYNLLKDKANIGIYFVNYAMHGKKEIDENLRQYCIQKDQKEKYSEYLSCFVKEGDFEKCLSYAGIDQDKLSDCISAADKKYKITQSYNDKSTWLNGRFPPFAVHDDLNKKYGVQGSPTLVINDRIASVSSRSPEAFKEAICNAFNTPPQECSQKLSDKVALPGFGGGEDENSSSGEGCKK